MKKVFNLGCNNFNKNCNFHENQIVIGWLRLICFRGKKLSINCIHQWLRCQSNCNNQIYDDGDYNCCNNNALRIYNQLIVDQSFDCKKNLLKIQQLTLIDVIQRSGK